MEQGMERRQFELARVQACQPGASTLRGKWTGPGHEWWCEEWAKSMSRLEQRPIHAWEVMEMVKNLKDGEGLRIAAPPREQAKEGNKQPADSRPRENWAGPGHEWWSEEWAKSMSRLEQRPLHAWIVKERVKNLKDGEVLRIAAPPREQAKGVNRHAQGCQPADGRPTGKWTGHDREWWFEGWPKSWLEPEQSSNQLFEDCQPADSRPTGKWTGHDREWWFEGWPKSWLEPEQSSNQLFEDCQPADSRPTGKWTGHDREWWFEGWPKSWLEPEQSSNQLFEDCQPADSRPTGKWTGHDREWWFEGWPKSWLEPEQSSNQLFED
ncbi:Hypothetical predicted protein [Xyrichtys novacula]|nr:Hypothetical predicted protein [Xyrichtys novacula]CAJ1057180.1 Hypothetical predicted protein [Xyrichtys novacula]CAJ1057181.1 Hypothetical predicted protein [Xyrichtys novacula]